MKKNLSNDEKYRNYRIRKVLRVVIMILMMGTIILSILSLWKGISFLYPLGVFVLATIITKYRNSLEFLENDKKKK